ncbi:MAG: hypothetical protein ABID04_02660 [Patescibacteria group bacterium]
MKKFLFVLSFLLVLFFPKVVSAASPTYGSANVDGIVGEWTPADHFSNLYRAGDPSQSVLSTVSLRYDCTNQILYAAVFATDGSKIESWRNGEHWIKINGNKLVDDTFGDDGIAPDFAWEPVSRLLSYANHWEASGPLTPTTHNISVHTQVKDGSGQSGQTAAVYNFPLTINCSTAVAGVIRFEAFAEARRNRIVWETANELDLIGFNLYRSRSKVGPYTKLNQSLIVAKFPGSPTGATYSFYDLTRLMGGSLFSGETYYRLDQISNGGEVTSYGPITLGGWLLDLGWSR